MINAGHYGGPLQSTIPAGIFSKVVLPANFRNYRNLRYRFSRFRQRALKASRAGPDAGGRTGRAVLAAAFLGLG